MPRVLVVDDDPSLRTTVAEFLEDAGYVVETAPNGVVALAKVHADRFAAILLDLMMPVMNGWEFLDACGDQLLAKHVPVAVVSAAYAPGAVASRAPVRAVLSKPFDLDVLEAIVQQLTAPRAETDSTSRRAANP
jgi:CheY-like chemotaxis protein